MVNPMMAALMGGKIGGIRQMMNAIRTAGDPQAALQQMAGSNPQVQQAIDLVRQNGGDARAAFFNKAQELGIDPESILRMIR